MIQSGKNIESINEKIAILIHEINQSGALGLTNIHKHCENFVMRLLNITYDLQLINLNKTTVTAPGLDIGDKREGIAYQITSDKSSEKVDNTLEKVLRFSLHTDFPIIKIFILGSKQIKYSINSNTSPHFHFDPKSDIVDFSDLIKDIQNKSSEKIQEISDFINEELNYTILNIKQNKELNTVDDSLIDVSSNLTLNNFKYFEHWSCKIRINGINLSSVSLFTNLNAFIDQASKKRYFPLFNEVYQVSTDAKTIFYTDKGNKQRFVNEKKESALKIENNFFHYEYSKYSSNEILLSDFTEEFAPLMIVVLMLKKYFNGRKIQLHVDIDLSTNGQLIHYNSNSIFAVKGLLENYVLNPKNLKFSKIISDDVDGLIDIIEQIVHSFIIDNQGPFKVKNPFLLLDYDSQKLTIEHFRKIYE